MITETIEMNVSDKTIFAIFLLILTLLSGCIASEDALFTTSTAIFPLPSGRYEEQRNITGRWEKVTTGTLGITGQNYSWQVDQSDSISRFSLHDAGNNYFILAVSRPGEPETKGYYYALLQRTNEGLIFHQPNCSDLFRLRAFDNYQVERIEKSECLYSNRNSLIHDLTSYAEQTAKRKRLVLVRR